MPGLICTSRTCIAYVFRAVREMMHFTCARRGRQVNAAEKATRATREIKVFQDWTPRVRWDQTDSPYRAAAGDHRR